mmetsp:Transcript_1701/g.3551  ORF Transcript_1701/g.3551 Transcript_1701/m.3551 type:complete len:204 (-) Transcript_1701:219-830(-)
MEAFTEEQQEEYEVLASMLGEDDVKIEDGKVQVSIEGETKNGNEKKVIVQFGLPSDYPEVVPSISFDVFYNRNMPAAEKSALQKVITQEAEDNLGMPMLLTLVEKIKEEMAELEIEPAVGAAAVEEEKQGKERGGESGDSEEEEEEEGGSAGKRNPSTSADASLDTKHLSKGQKRRMWNKLDDHHKLKRGWNWVDIISHLAKK